MQLLNGLLAIKIWSTDTVRYKNSVAPHHVTKKLLLMIINNINHNNNNNNNNNNNKYIKIIYTVCRTEFTTSDFVVLATSQERKYVPFYAPIHSSLWRRVCLCACLSVCLSVSLSVCLSVSLWVWMCPCLWLRLSVSAHFNYSNISPFPWNLVRTV